MKNINIQDLSRKIPIFPLTGAVLFPGTQLPLNIFEPRYVQMIDDALASPGRLLGMIQPNNSNQNTQTNSLKKVGCVGRISSFNEAENDRYLITLTGLVRFEVDSEMDVTTPYRQVLANFDKFKSDLEPQNIDGIDRSKLLALVKRYLEHRKILADWEIIKQTPTEQLINYSGILVPFTPEEKQLLLEAKSLITRGHALEALYQSYIFDLSGEKSDQLH
jgi:Lon protease-like protein|tara:strand:+ start:398 stop:1054 length:657 start_codon:yes stop_codon:yes gene_type:complete